MQPKIILTLLLALSISTFATHAQNKNPYKEIGKKGKTLTLSKGTLNEFFDEEDVQQIGTNLVNIRTMKIVKVITEEKAAKRLDNTIGKRFFSVDPLTKNYAYYSPYQFAGNSPVLNLDLDGAEPIASIVDMNNATRDSYYTLLGENEGERQYQLYKKGQVYGAIGALAIITDIYLTKGKISQFLLFSQLADIAEHNRAKTPERQAEQDLRSREKMADALIGFGMSRIIGSSIKFFSGPAQEEVNYLFRGTSEGFEGLATHQKLEITPTSSDPTIATIFAINSKTYGKGVLQVALPSELQGVEVTGNVLQSLEKEVAIGLKPVEFAEKTTLTISADQARSILNNMGIKLPANIPLDKISEVIKNTPRLSPSEIKQFYEQANKIKK